MQSRQRVSLLFKFFTRRNIRRKFPLNYINMRVAGKSLESNYITTYPYIVQQKTIKSPNKEPSKLQLSKVVSCQLHMMTKWEVHLKRYTISTSFKTAVGGMEQPDHVKVSGELVSTFVNQLCEAHDIGLASGKQVS